MDAVNPKKSNVKRYVKTTLIVIFCSTLLSVSTGIFLNPIGLYSGGVTGIAQIILHSLGLLTGKGYNYYQNWLGVLNFVFLLPFNILAWFKLSKKYALFTMLSSVIQTIVLSFSEFWASLGVFQTTLNGVSTYDMLACAIIAAVIGGFANGLMMRRGATSGGIVTFCQYLNLKKGKSVGSIELGISGLILLCGAVLSILNPEFDGIEPALYTLICFVLQSVVLDYVHTAYNKIKLEIVTEKGKAITKELIKDFPHGITITRGQGAYTMREKEILQVVIQSYESSFYFNIVKSIDPDAFVSVLPCKRIFGRFINKVID